MKPSIKESPSEGINIQDILFALFKHKWKISILTLLGLGVAAGIAYKQSQNPSYESRAKLLLLYVMERSAMEPEIGDRVQRANSTIIDTELAILGSTDLARNVAEKLGPERLLPGASETNAVNLAGGRVSQGLEASNQKKSNIINLSYRNESPELAVETLKQVIESYSELHLEIHRSTGAYDEVAKKADTARGILRQTETDINELKARSGVLDMPSTLREFETRRQAVAFNLMEAQTALQEQKAKVAELSRLTALHDNLESEIAIEGGNDPEGAMDEIIAARRESTAALFEFRDLADQLAILTKTKNGLLVRRKPTDPMVVSLERQIDSVQALQNRLVEKHPQLSGVSPDSDKAGGLVQEPLSSLENEKAIAAAFEAKVQAIEEQKSQVDGEVQVLSALGFELQGLERRRQMEDEKYRYFQTALDRARVDDALDPSRIPNIKVIQSPTPAVRSIDEKVAKIIMGVAGSGLALGLGLALFLELVVNRKVSRPTEIQTRLQLPLMMSIPYMRSMSRLPKLNDRESGVEVLGDTGDVLFPPVPANGKSNMAEHDSQHFIDPYAGAIRDRIIFNFEVNDITHKPKLVAVTGLSNGAGASTIAAGIAKSFAENGRRKVLLVDLNPAMTNGGGAHSKPADSILKAVEISKDDRFRTSQRNLYFASAPTRREGNSANALAPSALYELMPHLNASEFDYIIFDMLAMGPTSPTLSMAGFMDKVLLVLDAENTSREVLKWGYSELQRTKADVSCIFNKARSHAPRWVQGGV